MRIIIKEGITNGIPTLSIFPNGAEKLPLIFYLHGYGGDKEQALDYRYLLAKAGFYVISFDCHEHGLRHSHLTSNLEQQNRRFNSVYPKDTGIDMYIHMHEVIEQTGRDVELLTDYFSNKKEVDVNRIGVTGFSMGGFAAFYIAANNPSIKVVVPIGGRPSYKKAWDEIILSTSTYDQWSTEIDGLAEETEERTAFMEKIDPFENMVNFYPKPLLIINGDRDTDQPFLYSLELYRLLKPYYEASPNRLKLSMPFADHKLTVEIEEQACNWFKTYL
jgi:dienelactone hydrolase